MPTLAEINRGFMQKAQVSGLKIDCLADGDPNAELIIIAEAPGPRETQLKQPLIGGSGKLLWEVLAPYSITRRNCYITNVCKRQLVDDAQQGKNGASVNELSHWRGLLEWELAQLPNAKYVLALGGTSLHALTGADGIEQWRGSVLFGQRTIVPTYNPAFVMRKPNLEPIFRLDCSKLDMVMRDVWSSYDIVHHINPSPAEAVLFCDRMIQEEKPISLDIEVIAMETACVGFANDTHEGMSINFRDRTANRWTEDEERKVRYAIQRVVRHAKSRLVTQNGGFDAGWLYFKDRIKCKPIWMDTLLAHHTLHPIWPHNLGFLTAQYTTHPFYKDEKDAWKEGGDIDRFWRYNVKDCCITLACALAMERELKQQKMADFYFGHVMRLQPHLIQATVLGNRIDMEQKEALAAKFSLEVESKRAEFVRLANIAIGEDKYTVERGPNQLNPNSPKQLSNLLFRELRLQGKTASTDKANREAMAENPRTSEAARQMLIAMDEYARDHKLLSTYLNSKVDDDQRMRSDYKQYGVASAPGRLSSAQTLWGSGMNLQNQPEQLRGMYLADRGPTSIYFNHTVAAGDEYVYVYFDGAQAEARIVGWEAPIPLWKHQFELARLNPGSYDAHKALAAEMYKVPLEKISSHDYYSADTVDNDEVLGPKHPLGSLTLRGISKRCRHGLNYRMQPPRLATVTRMSIAAATSAFNAYHQVNPELRKWWDAVINEAKTNRMIFSCMGRRMEFLGSKLDEQLLDAIIAFKPQSALGDKVTYVQRAAQDDPRWPRTARIPFNNHDSLTAMCQAKHAKTVAQIMRQYMEEPLIIKGDALIIPSDFKMSVPDEHGVHRWSNMKKLKLEA